MSTDVEQLPASEPDAPECILTVTRRVIDRRVLDRELDRLEIQIARLKERILSGQNETTAAEVGCS